MSIVPSASTRLVPVPIPEVVRQSPVVTDSKQLTVSTVRVKRGYYDTVIFDDSPSKQHEGWLLGGFVINKSSKRAETREAAMDQHREALYAARTEQPKAVAS